MKGSLRQAALNWLRVYHNSRGHSRLAKMVYPWASVALALLDDPIPWRYRWGILWRGTLPEEYLQQLWDEALEEGNNYDGAAITGDRGVPNPYGHGS